MSEPEITEKYIAFFDILGWKHHVKASEEGHGMSAGELAELISSLGNDEDQKHIEKYGPKTCPTAPRIQKSLDFRVTSASDCSIVSVETSPAGVINLISHCWLACLKLLTKGIMCRGYIKRGHIYHSNSGQFGTGLNDVIERERQVSIFQNDIKEKGTPFIEVDQEVVQYIERQSDKCVKEMFDRMVKIDGDTAAIFPFQRLNHSFIIAGHDSSFDPQKEIASLNNVRKLINKMKEQVLRHTNTSDVSAVNKSDHYIRMLDEQLKACDQTEEVIHKLSQPFPAHRMKDI